MQVAIDLAESHHGVFTNLDYVQGRVLLKLPSTSPITNITVKLEGESQTLITPPPDELYRDRKPRPVHEFHKILYNTQVVFPEKELPGSSHYTLPPGQYEYPFRFKIPFNTTCHTMPQKALPSFPQYFKMPPPVTSTHIKAPLPPTLGGFPGLASIRYYVKATVNRKEFYKENPRQIHHLTFVPIEPPRPAQTATENYGRRTYDFPAPAAEKAPGLRTVFSGLKLNRSPTTTTAPSGSMPKIEVDARMPDPAIVTPLQPIPLRILIKRLDSGADPVYLQSLHVELVATTHIRAGQWTRAEPTLWVLGTHSNMGQLLSFPASEPANEKTSEKTAPPKRQIVLDANAWRAPVPASVAPSFKTCNISRVYDVRVRVGISHGARAEVILPLSLRCAVYSGIAPPPSLIAATAAPAVPPNKPAGVTKKPLSAQAVQNAALAQAGPSSAPAPAPAPVVVDDDEPPPPSYEDAMATTLAPVDGPRSYAPPAASGDDGFPVDQKRRGS